MANPFDTDFVAAIIENYNFTIVDMIEQPDENKTGFIIIHDIHPEEEVEIFLISKDENGEDVMTMDFNGPDVYTNDEAKAVLQEVMDMFVEVIRAASIEEESRSLEEENNGDN